MIPARSGKIFEEFQDHLGYLDKILNFILVILTRSCLDIQYEIQDLSKKSNIGSKNMFVEHVFLLQATLPETEQRPYSEVEALC